MDNTALPVPSLSQFGADVARRFRGTPGLTPGELGRLALSVSLRSNAVGRWPALAEAQAIHREVAALSNRERSRLAMEVGAPNTPAFITSAVLDLSTLYGFISPVEVLREALEAV